MPDVHFTNLLIVVAAAFIAPLALGFFPRLGRAAELVGIPLGIIHRPLVLRWLPPGLAVSVPAPDRLPVPPLLPGLQVRRGPLRRRPARGKAMALLVSFAIAIVAGLAL